MASERFGGTERLYGIDQTRWLGEQHVIVLGVGGVGSWAAEALVRTAVGRMTLIDLDDVCVSNTNRQSHAMSSTVGQMKVDVLAQRLALINHCQRQKIPLVTTGGAGGQTDPLQIQVTDLSRTEQDPLAARTRQLLRREYGFSRNPKRKFGVDCVYSTQQLLYPQANGDVCATKPGDDSSRRLDCATGFGASVMVTASFGMVAASRLVDKLLKVKERQDNPTNQTG